MTNKDTTICLHLLQDIPKGRMSKAVTFFSRSYFSEQGVADFVEKTFAAVLIQPEHNYQ